MSKFSEQLRDEPDDVIRCAADTAAFYGLFPAKGSFGSAAKQKMVEDVRGFRPDMEEPNDDAWQALTKAFEQRGIGSTGAFYLAGRPFQMAFYIGFALELKNQGVDSGNWRECRDLADSIKTRVKQEFGAIPTLARNILLHMLFPEHFEDTASNEHKHFMFEAFFGQAGLDHDKDVDEGLLVIRQHLEKKYGRQISFYEPEIREQWDPGSATPFGSLRKRTYLNGPFLREIEDLLQVKRQLIFEGPPGSGKTFVAEKFARWFTGQPVDGETPLDEHVEIVQFHQSYGYEDFVQGIRPETNSDNQLVYRVRDGIFLDMVERAKANPEDRFVLIIDEINRGNLSRVFGELLLLLEYRGQRVRLPYGVGDAAYLSIPENLYIIGTMNTADRSLAQIDYALRRRFYFVRFMPVENGRAEVYENWLARNVDGEADRKRLRDLFVGLNHGIRNHLNTDDLQVGHSYFMQDGIETDVVFDRVWRRAVRPLLEEYLHHHRNRDDILAALTPQRLAPSPAAIDELEPDTEAMEPGQV